MDQGVVLSVALWRWNIFKYFKAQTCWYYSVITPKCTMAHSHIITTDRYGRGMDHAGAAKPPQPLFSPSCFISSPLSVSLSLSVLFTRPPCQSASECPCPLPVCFIKPVRDEVKSWRQHSRLVSIFSSRCTPQAAGWSTVGCSIMKNNERLLLIF